MQTKGTLFNPRYITETVKRGGKNVEIKTLDPKDRFRGKQSYTKDGQERPVYRYGFSVGRKRLVDGKEAYENDRMEVVTFSPALGDALQNRLDAAPVSDKGSQHLQVEVMGDLTDRPRTAEDGKIYTNRSIRIFAFRVDGDAQWTTTSSGKLVSRDF